MIPSLNKIRKRTVRMMVIILIMLAVLVIRVGYWQIIRGEELKTKAKNQQMSSNIVTASRGNIYDRNGKVLAQSASVNTLICNPKDVANGGNAEIIATQLAPIIGMDYDEIYPLLKKNSQYQVIKKRLTAEETEAVNNLRDSEKNEELAKAFFGIYFDDDSKRYYPFNIAPHILGFTGYDNNGLQGIELTFDDELSGRAGSIEQNRTAKGTTLKENELEYINQSADGADVVLTIDETIQHFLEKHLEEAIAESELKEGAAGIVMNPKTGEILAMASKPDFDVNNPNSIEKFENMAFEFEFDGSKELEKLESGDYTIDGSETEDEDGEVKKKTLSPEKAQERIKELLKDRLAAMRNKMWRNKAVSDTYEPGSTFKIITAAAALEENITTLDTPFYCPGFKIVADRTISCHNKNGHGAQTFLEGVQHSCNPVFMELGLKLGEEKFMDYFRAFGLTETTGIELGGEANSIYYKSGMNEVDLACSSFGQGFQVSPIQLITAVSAVINGGNRMKPMIVKEIRDDTGVVKTYQPEVVNKVISQETSDTMRSILESVVSAPEGTGRNAYVKGYRVGGKTGTSEKGNRELEKRIASFIGFAPANDPEIVCLVMLDEPQVDNKYGGTIAAPLAGEIISDVLDYLGVEKQYYEGEEPDTMVEVPDVREMSVADAEAEFEKTKFTYKISGSGDTIEDQLPKPGIMLSEDSNVILYTEKTDEKALVTVPDVSGMDIENAKYELMAYGLNFEVVGAGQNESSGAYAVKQSVEPGEKVEPASVIGVEFRHTSSD